MKPKTLVLLAVAVGCGFVAVLGVQQAMSKQPGPARVATAKVLVALENIDTGVRISKSNTFYKEIPIASIPEDAIKSEKEVDQRAARFPFVAGDMIRRSKLTDKGDWGKSVNIPKGMRVIAIPVDDTHTISGLLRPGDRVDVLVTYLGRDRGRTRVTKTRTLLEYVEVFNTDSLTATKLEQNSKNSRAKNVGLLLTPEQAGFVILAKSKGTLSLSWRRRGDDELAQTKVIDEKLMEELQGTVGIRNGDLGENEEFEDPEDFENQGDGQKLAGFLNENASSKSSTPVVPAAPRNPTWTVNIYNGNSIAPQEFDIPESTKSTEKAGEEVTQPIP